MPLNCLSLTPTSLINFKTKKLNVGPANSPSCLPTFTCNLNVTFEDIVSVAQNKVLIAAGVSAAIGQLSKPFTGVLLYGRAFDIKAIIQAGGFPSTHSSAVVATATCLALERGFSDSIFGMAAVYAGLIMYDAQGVRREVGIHAKTLNQLLLERQTKSVPGVAKDVVNSVPGKSSSTNMETALAQLLESGPQRITQEEDLKTFETARKESETTQIPFLKESIGHTEVEVIAGALLGFLVSLMVNIIM